MLSITNWMIFGNYKYKQQEFTSSGLWTRPTNHNNDFARVILVGAGGGGSRLTIVGGGGGGGEVVIRYVNVSSITKGSGTVSITIGSGGTDESDGSDSTFGAFLTANGGDGAIGSAGGLGGGNYRRASETIVADSVEFNGDGTHGYPTEFGSTGGSGGSGGQLGSTTIISGRGGDSYGPGGLGTVAYQNGMGGGGGSWGPGANNQSSANPNTGGGGGGGPGTYYGGSGYCLIQWFETF